MKKLIKVCLLLCLCLLLCEGLGMQEARALDSVANGSIDNITWILWSDGNLVFRVYYDTGSASIPNMAADSTSEWLAYKTQIKTVTITHYDNTNITSIGSYAFAGCTNLTQVDIPDGTVTSIGSNAFNGCSKLTSLTLPANITSVGSGAFSGTASGFKVRVASATSATAKAISDRGYSFYVNSDNNYALQCSSAGVVTLKSYTGSATSVTLPSHIQVIGYNAFKDTSVTSLTLTNNVSSVSSSAFNGANENLKVFVPTANGNAAKAVGSVRDYYLSGDTSFGLRCSNDGVVTLYTFTGSEENVVIPN